MLYREERCDILGIRKQSGPTGAALSLRSPKGMEMFTGFTQKTSDFIWELSFNNERPWFNAHKNEYEQLWGTPFKAETLSLMREHCGGRDWSIHISRIYRDARRLFGRGPYKDHLWFSIREGSDGCPPVFWFEMGAAGYAFGMGFYDATSEMMEAFRKSVDANPARFAALAEETASFTEFCIDGERYKRPKGTHEGVIAQWYDLKRPGLECRRDFGGELFSPELPAILADEYKKLLPMYEYFREIYLMCR